MTGAVLLICDRGFRHVLRCEYTYCRAVPLLLCRCRGPTGSNRQGYSTGIGRNGSPAVIRSGLTRPLHGAADPHIERAQMANGLFRVSGIPTSMTVLSVWHCRPFSTLLEMTVRYKP